LFSLYAASTIDKQRALMAFIGDKHRWDFSMKEGSITFNGKHTFPVQIIGTESTASMTWLWAWANAESGIPKALVTAATKLKAFGGEHHIDELHAPELKLGEVNGSLLAMIATGLMRGDAYYRGTYDGGALYVVIDAPVLRTNVDHSPQRIVSVYTQAISTFPVDHRKAWKAYLEYKGCQIAEEPDSITGVVPNGQSVRASFDAKGRAANVQALITK
jgi:hypothetical protein